MALLEHEASSFNDYVAAGGGRGLERALSLPPEQVIEEISLSGLRGRGGAGFPTGTKWLAVRSTGTGPRFVVCNAAEGEPATFKDRLLIRRNPYRVLDGLGIAAYAVGAERAYVGLKETFTTEAEVLATALGEMEAAGALPIPVEILAGPDHYLLGEETGLLEMIEDRDPLPRVARPYYLGLFAKPPDENPTAVNNVETLSHASHILAEGPDWLRQRGTEGSPGTMLFTIAGDVEREGVYEADMGTPLREVLERAGGVRDGREVKVVLPGASSTALLPQQLDTSLAFETMAAVGSGLGAGGFAVYDETTCIVEVALLFLRFLHVESCAQCIPCKLHSEAITGLLQAIDRGEGTEDHVERILRSCRMVTDGQRCYVPTAESLVVQSIVRVFVGELAAHLEMGCPLPRPITLPKLVEFDEETGHFTFDEKYARKRPNWTYADEEVQP
jgi:NADH:ubiquinone oxidoreductase subunit F (NADH-binding)